MTTDDAGDVTAAGGDLTRQFAIGEDLWIARLAGSGAAGSGSYGLGMLESIEFAPADGPGEAVREALLQRGRFHHLFDAELVALHARARRIKQRRSKEESH